MLASHSHVMHWYTSSVQRRFRNCWPHILCASRPSTVAGASAILHDEQRLWRTIRAWLGFLLPLVLIVSSSVQEVHAHPAAAQRRNCGKRRRLSTRLRVPATIWVYWPVSTPIWAP